MKFSKYFMLAGAAAMLTACSSEEPFVGPDNNGNPALEDATVAYFNIAMAADANTRTVTYENGDASEYAVKNGKILIFGMEGSTDNLDARMNSKFVKSAKLVVVDDAGNPLTPGASTSTLDATYTKVRASFEKGTFQASQYSKYFGVVVLNYDEDAEGTNSWLPATEDGAISFKEWAENKDMHGAFINDNGFVMTNAGLYNAERGAYVLSVISTGKGFIEDEAKNLTGTAATFYVQRAAAKVSVSVASGAINVEDVDNQTVTFNKWGLDLTRKTTYPIQNVWSDVTSLFGKTPYSAKSSSTDDFARCMWASSKTYNTALADLGTSFSRYTEDGNMTSDMETTALYVRENTMRPDLMSKANVTRVVFNATYKVDGTTEDLIQIDNTVYTKATLAAKAAEIAGVSYTAEVKEKDAGHYNLTDVLTLKQGENEVATNADIYREVAAELGIYTFTAATGEGEVSYYPKGECWYVAYVKHFGDETDGYSELANNEILYPSHYNDPKWTGRFGILRNNWYELKVGKVHGIGFPTVPDPDPDHAPDAPDDLKYRHLDVDVNILNWTKRSQNVDF